jgi:hypothetical protein
VNADVVVIGAGMMVRQVISLAAYGTEKSYREWIYL